MANRTARPSNKPQIEYKRVLDAYFATRSEEVEYEEGSGETYTVKSGDNLTKIAKANDTTVAKLKKDNSLSSDMIRIGQKLTISVKKEKGKKITFNYIKSADLGDEVYVVVKTHLIGEGKKVWLNVRQGQAKGVVEENTSIALLQEDKEIQRPEAIIGDYCNEPDITNGDDYKDAAIFKFSLGGKDTKTYSEALEKLTDKKTSLFLIIDAHSPNGMEIVYNGTNPGEDGQPDLRSTPNYWLDMDGKWFQMKSKDSKCSIDESHFFTEYDKEFSSNKLSEANKTSLKKIFKSINEYYSNEGRCCNLKHIAYMLATAKHETAHTFDPISEYGGKSYFERMYDPVLGKSEGRRNMAKRNGNTTQGDGVKYKGRGYVQLTWKNNYQTMKTKFGVDLVGHPDKALDHELAIKIMIYGSESGVFTGKKLSNYINDSKTDYFNARRVINGTDKADSIKGYAEKIEKCLKIAECNC